METVFDALKAMGKATSIELAARLDISREEVLNELWELKKAGFVDKSAYTCQYRKLQHRKILKQKLWRTLCSRCHRLLKRKRIT
ncbi:hypothetical protein [Escherichia coli]|uniref:hypothetical protein n=1 Tax=Escherichia coli TaxID=562 RepID=UPI0003916DB6|nr:hypothetical protein [Escherichia coli]ERB17799.1 hypothetical protein G918_02507 [Escherichia coli UMEA 3150-1]HAW3994987.1 hypothetical protein [Escherichia coli]